MPTAAQIESIHEALPDIFCHCPDTILRLDAAGRVVDFYPGKDGSPFAPGQPTAGSLLTDLLPLPDGHSWKNLIDSALAGELITVTSQLPDSDRKKILEARIFAYTSQKLVTIIRDITKSRSAEATLEILVRGTAHLTGKSFFESLVNLLTSALHVRYAMVSEVMEGETTRLRTIAHSQNGFPTEALEYDLAGTPSERVFGKKLAAYYGNVWEKFPEDPLLKSMNVQCYIGAPISSSSGSPLGILVVMSDDLPPDWISKEPLLTILAARCGAEIERRHAVEALHHQQLELAHAGRLATMGELCGGIVHEVRQPLYSIANFAVACKNRLTAEGNDPSRQQQADLCKWLDSISKATTSAQQIISRLHRFLRRQDKSRSTLDPNDVVKEVLSLLEFEFQTRRIRVACNLQADQMVVANRVQLQQVLVNLIYNACEALESNPAQDRHITLCTSRHDDELEVIVRDNGPGLTCVAARQLFEPFYTSKEEGLGLGLTISQSIVEAHHGRIWFESPTGPGTIFHFTLPRIGSHQP